MSTTAFQNISVSGTISIAGNSTCANLVSSAKITAPIANIANLTTGALNCGNVTCLNETINGNLSVNGNSYLWDTQIQGNVNVTGETNLHDTEITGDLILSGNIIANNGSFTNDVTVSNVTISDNLIVNDTTSHTDLHGLVTICADKGSWPPLDAWATGVQFCRNLHTSGAGEINMICRSRLGVYGGFYFHNMNSTDATPHYYGKIDNTGIVSNTDIGGINGSFSGNVSVTGNVTAAVVAASGNVMAANVLASSAVIAASMNCTGQLACAQGLTFSAVGSPSGPSKLGFTNKITIPEVLYFTDIHVGNGVQILASYTIPAGTWLISSSAGYVITAQADVPILIQSCISTSSSSFVQVGQGFVASVYQPQGIAQPFTTIQCQTVVTFSSSTTIYLLSSLARIAIGWDTHVEGYYDLRTGFTYTRIG